MQILIALSALVAVAVAAPSAVWGGSGALVQGPVATIAGPSGTIVANTGAIATSPVASVVAPSVLGRTVVVGPSVGLGWSGLGLGAHGLVGAHGLIGNPWANAGLLGHNGVIIG